jgi:hypothetical protein
VNWLLIACIVGIAAGVGMLYRNLCVYHYRLDILDQVSALTLADMQLGQDWEWRYEMFNTDPSYEAMLLQFWRPLDSFYKDSPMLEPPPGMIV